MFKAFRERMEAKRRVEFLRRMLAKRINSDPAAMLALAAEGIRIEDLPPVAIESTPEASILRIVERFIQAKNLGASDTDAVQLVHADLSLAHAMMGTAELPEIRNPTSIWFYAVLYVDTLYAESAPIPNDHILNLVWWSFGYFNRMDLMETLLHKRSEAEQR